MNLAKLEQEKMSKHYELQELRYAFENQVKRIQSQIADIEKQQGCLLANMDETKVQIAESVLRFSQGFSRLDKSVIKRAIEDIANGCKELSYQYLGIKDYAHWTGQRSDHNYGYGPKHGYIVFSIGLKQPNQSLSSVEQEASIYYLYQLLENQTFVNALLEKEQSLRKVRA